MPFLFPAIAAAICDISILCLSRHAPEHGEDTSRRVFQSNYMYSLALIRLFLLLIPLPYHSYNGKALKCPILFQLFYGTTLIVVFFHALSLIMVDPSSLSSIFTSFSGGGGDYTSLSTQQHQLVTRNLWWSLILTVLSTLSHVALFFHVRSTAPSDAEFQRPKVLLYYVKEKNEDTEREGLLSSEKPRVVVQTSTKSCHAQNASKLIVKNGIHSDDNGANYSTSVSSSRVQELSNKLVMDLQSSLNKAKKEWTKRLEEYHSRNINVGHGGSGSATHDSLLLKQPPTPFRVILELFAGEDVMSNGRMDAVYNHDSGVALMFFIPQLLSFLLHGAYDLSPQLEEWILDICRRNVYFAHKCYWFLRAWALESTNIGEATNSKPMARLNNSSSLASFETVEGDMSADGHRSCSSKLLPEERAVIEELMRKIMRCGEDPAKMLHFGSGDESKSSDLSEVEKRGSSPSALMLAAESGAIPIDPTTGNPSPRHFECLAATRRFGFLSLDDSLITSMRQSKTNNCSLGDTSYFDATPVFLDALITIADSLFRVSRENRAQELKRQLNLLEVEALPSNEIYIPLQNPYHRVWRISADESIAISTKERVPCIVCLEVVDYSPDEIPTPRDVRRLLEQRSNGMASDRSIVLSENEREMVANWRSERRDPHRRETALEKLTYSMKYKIGKIPKQVTSSMKEQIKRLKTATTDIEEFWTVRVPESFSFEQDSETGVKDLSILPTMEPMPARDIERGDVGEDTLDGNSSKFFFPVVPVQPGSPRLSKSSQGRMGQWTPPSPKATDLQTAHNTSVGEIVVPTLKHRSYQTVSTGRQRSSGRQSSFRVPNSIDTVVIKPGDETGTPSKPPSKPPPVVFKENWKDKEDRIRIGSAFGSLPGWRLLPVLVKSNDDLRQEQLASQLIYRMALVLARERIPVWLCPYEIVALEASGGIIEAIPDTISIASLKKNDPDYTSLKGFFDSFFFDPHDLSDAKANFCESLAGYSMVSFLLQIKDRHNGNILIDNRGHLIHIDFGFFFLSSPGKNTGFESAPFKLTREFVEVLDGPESHLFGVFRSLCYRSFIALRKHCQEIILLVEMLKLGNEELGCFRGRPDDAIRELRQRFRLDLNDRACLEYVNALIDESLENWRTNWYDRYQRYCVGVL